MNRIVGLGLLVFLAALAIVVPVLAPDPNSTDYAHKLAGPSAAHLLGTDQAGRDVLARLASGARISLGAALLVGVITLVLGVLIGMSAALLGGFVDSALSRLIDVSLAIPHLVLALAIVGVLGPGLRNLIIAMAVSGWAPLARISRALARDQLGMPYVTAARMAGVGRWRIARVHAGPPTLAGALAVATLGLGEVILGLAGLSFLGLGAAPPTAEWGQMVAEGRWYASRAPWLVAAPGIVIVASVACVALLSDAITERTRR